MAEHKHWVARVTAISVGPPGASTLDDHVTLVQIENEGGEYVTLQNVDGSGLVAITPEEWPAIRRAVNQLIRDCRPCPTHPAP